MEQGGAPNGSDAACGCPCRFGFSGLVPLVVLCARLTLTELRFDITGCWPSRASSYYFLHSKCLFLQRDRWMDRDCE